MTDDTPGAPPQAAAKDELLRRTLAMLILQSLSVQPMHGYAVAQHIERLSDGVLSVEQGSPYPALERLQQNGLVTSGWGESPTGRRARYYAITGAGRARLGERVSSFDRVLAAVARVMDPA
jgi:PadR family transcriptional regulator PadR